jgi:hypothetical protein
MATLGADGQWSAPEAIATTGRAPLLRFNARGDAALVWMVPNFLGTGQIQGSVRPAGGQWSPPRALPTQSAAAVAVQVGPDGDALAVWQDALPDHPSCPDHTRWLNWVSAATLSGADGWSTPAPLGAPGCGQPFLQPQLAIDARGDALSVVQSADAGHPRRVMAADRPAGGDWSLLRTLGGESAGSDNPQVVLDPAGEAIALWERSDGTTRSIVSADFTFNVPAQVDAPAIPSPAGSLGRLVPSAPQIAPSPPPDRTAPVVLAAMAARVLGLATADERPARRARPLVRVRVRARDNATGIARMQFARNRGRPAAARAFASLVTLPLRALPRWVRVRDGAGNSSRWVAVRLIR